LAQDTVPSADATEHAKAQSSAQTKVA